jgi:hypothetical protein
MPVDEQILVAGTSAVPLTYTVPNAIEAALLCVNATVDGTAASGAFLAAVEIISDGGVVVARCPCFTTIAAGGSAEISWFRVRNSTAISQATTTAYGNLMFTLGGLVLYWKLDDATGATTAADSAGSNPGTVFYTVTFQQPKLADVTAASFGSGMVGSKVDVPGIQANQLMSVVVWVKTTAAGAQNAISWSDTSSPGGRWFHLWTTNTGVVVFEIFGVDATGHAAVGTVPVNDGVKHSVIVTYGATVPATGAGAVMSIYIDGVLDTATPVVMGGWGLANQNHALVLGARWVDFFDDPSGINKFVGTLDEFAIFTSTLTAANVAAIDAAGRIV